MVADQQSAERPLSAFTPAIACLLGGLAIALTLLHVLPLGLTREWFWPRNPVQRWDEVLPAIIAFALILAVILGSVKRFGDAPRWQRGAAVVVLVILSFALQLGVAKLSPAGLYELPFAISVPRANSYFREAVDIASLREYLANYEDQLKSEPFRVQLSTHPAGPVVFFCSVQRLYAASPDLTELTLAMADRLAPPEPEILPLMRSQLLPQTPELRAAAWCSALLLMLAASLTLALVYAVAGRLLSHGAGLMAAAFVVFIPSLNLFGPAMDQLLVLLGGVVLWLIVVAWDKRLFWTGLLAGGVLALSLQFSLSLIVVAAVACATMMLRDAGRGRGITRWPVLAMIGALSGAAIFCAALYVAIGYDVLGVWVASLKGNERFNELAQRSYAPWLAMNVMDWATFLGLPLAALSAAFLARPRAAWSGAALYIVLLLLNLTGANRGEVARLWMPLMPLAAIAAAHALALTANWQRWLAPILILLFAQLVVLKVSLDVLSLYQAG